MGNIKHIERLENYIEDFGSEISKVKKASEYLELIEDFQAKITEVSAALGKSSNQLKLYQDIMESKLELFLTTAKNIEGKQQSLEQTQANIITNLSELKQSLEKAQLNIMAGLSEVKEKQDKNEKEVTKAFSGISQLANNNRDDVISELNKLYQRQEESLAIHTKTSKIYFAVNVTLSSVVVCLLVYLLVR